MTEASSDTGPTIEQKIVAQLWSTSPNSNEYLVILNQRCNYSILAIELVTAATACSKFERRFVDYITLLITSQKASWDDFLLAIAHFDDFDNIDCYHGLLQILSEAIPSIQCRSFDSSECAKNLMMSLVETFGWLLAAIGKNFQEFVGTKEGRDFDAIVVKPLTVALEFLQNKFTGRMIIIANRPDIRDALNVMAGAIVAKQPSECIQNLAKQLIQTHDELYVPKPFEASLHCVDRYKMRKPSVRTVTSIFACYRVLSTVDEIAEAYEAFAGINGMSFDNVVFDAIHSTILMQAEEKEEPIKSTQRRIIFRWHIAVFFYLKLSKVFATMVRRFHRSKDDVAKAIGRILKDSKMTLDLVDKSWKDFSLRSFLLQCVKDKAIDQPAADELIRIRLEQMASNPELANFSKTEEHADRTNEIVTLKSTAEIVGILLALNTPEKLANFLHVLLRTNGHTFDAVAATFCVDSNLAQFSARLASLNLFRMNSLAQSPGTKELLSSFDYSFLLLTRISLNYPSISLKLIVNGSEETSAAETNGIYYKWANRYLKRVRRPKINRAEDEAAEKKRLDEEIEKQRKKLEAEMRKIQEEKKKQEKLTWRATRTKALIRLLGIETKEEEQMLAECEEDEDIPPFGRPPSSKGNFQKIDDMIDKYEKNESGKSGISPEKAGPSHSKDDTMDPIAGPVTPSAIHMDQVISPSGADASMSNLSDADMSSAPPNLSFEHPPSVETVESEKFEGMTLSPVDAEERFEWDPNHEDGEDLPKVSHDEATEYLHALKERRPFWESPDKKPLDVCRLIFAMPAIGDILLEEYNQRHLDRQNALNQMKCILHGLHDLGALVVCLVQWLDCQKDSPARRILAQTIRNALEENADEDDVKWPFVSSMLKQYLQEMSNKPVVMPEVSMTAFTIAKRFCPQLNRSEIPDFVQLKKAWIYAQRQAWASPHVIRFLEHSNLAEQHKKWIAFFTNYMMKLMCGEMMIKAIDMISSFLFLDPFLSLIKMLESLVEYQLDDKSPADIRFEQPFVIPLVRLLTQVLFLSAWVVDCEKQRRAGKEPKKKRAKFEPIPPDEQNTAEAKLQLLDETIEVVFNKLSKNLRQGTLSSVTCVIFHIMRMIANAPPSPQKIVLLKRIHPKLIFELAYIDASSIPYEMFDIFCENGNPEHDAEKLRFLCVLRRQKLA